MAQRELFIIWGENPEHGAEPTGYVFASEAEESAFLRGAEEATGWGDFDVVPSEDYRYDANIDESVPAAKLSAEE